MKELYRGFKKVGEDEKSATLKHENGHKLTVAKSGLNKQTLKMLEKLPLYQAEGTPKAKEDDELSTLQKEMEAAKEGNILEELQYSGEANKPQYEPEKPEPGIGYKVGKAIREYGIEPIAQGIKDTAGAYKMMGSGLGGAFGGVGAGLLNEPVPTEQPAQQPLAQPPVDPTTGLAAQPAPTAQPEAARQVMAQPQAIAPKAPAKPRTPDEILADPRTSLSEKYAAHMQRAESYNQQMKAEDERFAEAMKNDEIRPQTIYGNKDFGQKISTFVGLLLGGLGAGLTGGENVVQKMLDKQIDMDVQEQKRQSDKKQNLYKIHLERLGNQREAEIATANNLRQVALIKMEEAAGLLGGNKAAQMHLQAGMAETLLKYEQARMGLANTVSQRQAMEQAQKGGTEISDVYDPARDRIVRVPDTAGRMVKYYSRTPGAAEKLQEKANGIANAKEALAEMGQAIAVSSGRIPFTEGRKKLESISARALLALGQAADVSPKLYEKIEKLVGEPSIYQSAGEAELKRREALKMVDQMSKTLIEGSLQR
jgi:hypothetical protein